MTPRVGLLPCVRLAGPVCEMDVFHRPEPGGEGGKEARLTPGPVDSGRRLRVLVRRRATVLAVGRREPGADRVARAGPRAVAEHRIAPSGGSQLPIPAYRHGGFF